MSTNTAVVLIVALLVLTVIFLAFRFRKSSKVKINAPFGMGLEVDTTNNPPPSIQAEDLKSKKGGLNATGTGIDIKRVEVETDINLTGSIDGPKA